MSTNVVPATDDTLSPAALSARRAAFRLAFGVTACFVIVEALDWDATFLAPLLAANMLVKLTRPPTLAQALGLMVLIALSTGAVLVLIAALIGNPSVLIIALALVIYVSFYAHRRGAPDLVTLLFQISAVALPTLAVLSPDSAGTFAVTLLMAAGVAIITAWGAFAAFPVPPDRLPGEAPAQDPTPQSGPSAAARNALLDALVLLPFLVWYILDATQVAVVVLITIVTVLRQRDSKLGQRTAFALILANLIGGIAAAIVYNLVSLNTTLLFFVACCLAASLLFAGRIVTAGERAPIYAIGFATFILLLGLGMSPLPGGSGEAFADRLSYVLLASLYAIGAVSIVQHWRAQT